MTTISAKSHQPALNLANCFRLPPLNLLKLINSRVWLAALVAAAVAMVPVFYLYLAWPEIQEFIPIHYGRSGAPDHFVSRDWLWNIVWFPTLAFAVLTFLPQVHEGQSLFWSSYEQRRTRLVVVLALGIALAAFIRQAARHSRDLPQHRFQPATRVRQR